MVKKKRITRERRLERELLWIICFALFLVLVFITTSALFRSFNTFRYEGVTFTREAFGKLIVYHNYYSYKNHLNDIVRYDLYVRNDPRNNSIPFTGDSISLKTRTVFITLNTNGLTECSDSLLALGDLTRFFIGNDITVFSGNMNRTDARLNKQEYVTCEYTKQSEVIQIMRGNETSINVLGTCANIVVGSQCDILDAIEKYKVRAVIDRRTALRMLN